MTVAVIALNQVSEWHKTLPPSADCVMLAMLSGFFNTVATVAIAYPCHRAARSKTPMSRTSECIVYSANLIFMGLSISLGILANGMGAVAVAFPLGVGTNLLSNMVMQSFLGIAQYTKSMTVGTLVLAAAVMILPDNGPGEPAGPVDILAELTDVRSIVFISLCLCSMVVGCVSLRKKWVESNSALLVTYAMVGCTGTVLNNSISKIVQLHNISIPIKLAFWIVYMAIGALCLGIAARANGTLEDPSLFVPLGAGVNLVLTFLAGNCIWGDYKRVTYPLAYCMIYVLVVLGTYLVSSFDLLYTAVGTDIVAGQVDVLNQAVQGVTRGRAKTMTPSALGAAQGPSGGTHGFFGDDNHQGEDGRMGKALKDVWRIFKKEDDPAFKSNNNEGTENLVKCLRRAMNKSVIDHNSIVDLCVKLVEETAGEGRIKTATLEHWMLENLPGASLLADRDDLFEGPSSFIEQDSSTSLLRTSKPRHQSFVLPSPKQLNRINSLSSLTTDPGCGVTRVKSVSNYDMTDFARQKQSLVAASVAAASTLSPAVESPHSLSCS